MHLRVVRGLTSLTRLGRAIGRRLAIGRLTVSGRLGAGRVYIDDGLLLLLGSHKRRVSNILCQVAGLEEENDPEHAHQKVGDKA
jgi:hypothetical protein